MPRKRPTIADLRAMKGSRQLTVLRVMTAAFIYDFH